MKQYNNKYIKCKRIASNYDRKVYLFQSIHDKKLYICKKIKIENETSISDSINQELNFLKQFSKPEYSNLNLVRYIEDFITKKSSKSYHHLNIITEYYEGGDVSNLKELDFLNILYLLIKITLILREFEKENIIHRDIKPANIFYKSIGLNKLTGRAEYEFYLGDLGSSKRFELTIQDKGTLVGTTNYLAPEVWSMESYSSKVDIYSLGKSLLEISRYNTSLSSNRIYISLFVLMISDNPNDRPSPLQILEFLSRSDSVLRLSLLDQCHRNYKSTIQYINQNCNFSRLKKKITFNIKIGEDGLNGNNKLNFNQLDGFDINQSFSCIGFIKSGFTSEYYIEVDQKYYNVYIFKNFSNWKEMDAYFKLLREDEVISKYFPSDSKVLQFDFQDKIIGSINGQEISDDGKNYYILVNQFDSNFKQVCLDNPTSITKTVQLKLLFKMIMVFFKIIEKGDENMLHFYFSNLNSIGVYLSQYQESTNEYHDVSLSIVCGVNMSFSEPFNILQSIFKLFNIETKDSIIDQLYDNFDSFISIKLPLYYSFKSVYNIISKEKERLTRENEYLREYYHHLEQSYTNITNKCSKEVLELMINTTLKPLKSIKQFHSKSSSKVSTLNISKDADNNYLGICSYFVLDNLKCVIDLINYQLEQVSYNEHLLISNLTKVENNHYFTFYKLPSKLVECYNNVEEFELTRSKFTTKETDIYFWNLANRHIVNIATLKSKYSYPFLYCLETIIVNEELFYIYDYLSKSPFNIIGSIYDIGLYVYGDNSSGNNDDQVENGAESGEGQCKQLLLLDLFKYLNYIYNYSILVQSGHLRMEYSLMNSVYYLNKSFSSILDSGSLSNNTLISYTTIQIGQFKFNILDFLVLNFVKDKFLIFDYKLMIMVLEESITSQKYYCIRKQHKKEIDIDTDTCIEFKQIKNELGAPFNGDIIIPDYIVQDFNTSYHFYKFNDQFSSTTIKTIEDIKEKDYNDIGIIRSLLYFIEYLLSNPVNSTLNIFIKSTSIQNQQNVNSTCEPYLLFFDLSYFIKVLYGVYIEIIEWEQLLESIYSGKSIISNYLQINNSKVSSDEICLKLIDRINSITNIIRLYNIKVVETIKENVEKVELNGKHYIRKITGTIKIIKESLESGGHWSLIFSNETFKPKIKSLPINQLKNYLDILSLNELDPTILNYQFNSEFKILNKIKGMQGVVQICDYYINNDLVYILIDYCENSTNLSNLSKLNIVKLSIYETMVQILKQMVEILVNLEKFDIYHCDIKNENILIQINQDNQIKCTLSDFGISGFGNDLKSSEHKYYSNLGTKGYQAPEIFIREYRSKNELKSLSNKMDIYSLGCVMINLISEFKINVDETLSNIINQMTEKYYDDRIDLFSLAQLVNNLNH